MAVMGSKGRNRQNKTEVKALKVRENDCVWLLREELYETDEDHLDFVSFFWSLCGVVLCCFL